AALRTFTTHPLVVLALARPEIGAVFPMLWQHRSIHKLALAPLGKIASANMVRQLLPDISASRVDSLVRIADGHAFFLEELIRAAGERSDPLRDSIVSMVQSRIEALEPRARHLLRAASIFGEAFWIEGIAHLLTDTATAGVLEPWLELLVKREVVVERRTS